MSKYQEVRVFVLKLLTLWVAFMTSFSMFWYWPDSRLEAQLNVLLVFVLLVLGVVPYKELKRGTGMFFLILSSVFLISVFIYVPGSFGKGLYVQMLGLHCWWGLDLIYGKS